MPLASRTPNRRAKARVSSAMAAGGKPRSPSGQLSGKTNVCWLWIRRTSPALHNEKSTGFSVRTFSTTSNTWKSISKRNGLPSAPTEGGPHRSVRWRYLSCWINENTSSPVLSGLHGIQERLAGEIPRARAELAKHFTEITLTPEGGSYKLSVEWDLLGDVRSDGAGGRART